jgi:hypothetical protein
MAFSEPVLDAVHDPDPYLREPPFTAWPDPGRGFMVLDMRTMTWAAGPFRTPGEAYEATDRLNEQVVANACTK